MLSPGLAGEANGPHLSGPVWVPVNRVVNQTRFGSYLSTLKSYAARATDGAAEQITRSANSHLRRGVQINGGIFTRVASH